MLGYDVNTYQKRWQSFGWNAIKIDGHNFDNIIKAFQEARETKGVPTIIIAKTIKGKGFGNTIENQLDWHGKALGADMETVINILKTHIKSDNPDLKVTTPEGMAPEEIKG
jgi:transketolase